MQTLIFIGIIILTAALLLWFVFPEITSSIIVNSGIRILGFKHHKQQIGDTDFHWLESSGKGPALVMVHGLNGDATNWIMMAPQLKRYRLIIPDMPPFGDSRYQSGDTSAADFSIEAQAKRLDALVQELGLKQFYLAGNSMGGYIAGIYTSNHPEKILGQILLSPASVKSAPILEHFEADLAAGNNPLKVETNEDFHHLVGLCFYKQPYVPGPVKRAMFKRFQSISKDCDSIFHSMLNDTLALEDALADNPTPTLIIWGKEDNILNPEGAPILQQAMKDAILSMPEKTGHVPMLEYPKVTANALADFISQQESKSKS